MREIIGASPAGDNHSVDLLVTSPPSLLIREGERGGERGAGRGGGGEGRVAPKGKPDRHPAAGDYPYTSSCRGG